MEKELGQEVLARLDGLKAEMGTEIANKVGQGLTELKGIVAQEIAEKIKNGYADPGTKEAIARIEAKYADIEKELFRPGFGRKGPEPEFKSAGEQVAEDEGLKEWREGNFRARGGSRSYAVQIKGGFFPMGCWLDGKSLISLNGLGSATSGVQAYTRIPGIIQAGRIELRIRDIMTVRPMPGPFGQIDFMRQNAVTNSASPQTEGGTKAESTITYTTGVAPARTIAHWAQVTTQALADIPGLQADINDTLLYGLKVKEESEILAGDNLGTHLHGIITQATAYASGTYNVAGDTKLDKIRHVILQVRLALRPCEGIVLNPRDVHDIDLLKDENGGSANTGRYIVGDPRTGPEVMFLWGKPVVESDSITYGQFVAGPFRSGAILYDRQQAVIDISLENGTNFQENEATIRAEERVALAVTMPAGFIQGTF